MTPSSLFQKFYSIHEIFKLIFFETKTSTKVISLKKKRLFKIDDIDVNKILFSKKEPYCKKGSFKYFIRYNGNDDIGPLCISFLK